MDTRNVAVEEMERYVARFANLHGSNEAYIDSRLPGHRRHKPPLYNPETYLPFSLPGLGLVVMFVLITAIGAITAGFIGRTLVRTGSLGNRSILYRPDDPSVNAWLNERLSRTEFMPFAPVTLAEHADDSFVGIGGSRDTARFMTIAFDATESMKKQCPGVVHIDGTARPQILYESDNPSYYRILKEFHRETGISSLVNTSFNLHEEPIVCTPEDAIRAFQIGHLDMLAIGPFLATHPEAGKRTAHEREGPTG